MDNNAHINIDMPPGDDEYNPGQDDGRSRENRSAPQGLGAAGFQPPGGWWLPPWMAGQSQFGMPPPPIQTRPPRVELPLFWLRDPRTWFTLSESKFQLAEVTDSRLRFNFILPALNEDTLVQVRHILHAADVMADPYSELKSRLLEIYTPSPLELGFQLLHSPELGDRRPSTMMSSMLALLPPGEVDGVLFKCIFLSRLPSDIRDSVATQSKKLSSRELGTFADELWFARNSRHSQYVMAVAEPNNKEVEELTDAVAAVRLQPKKKFNRKFGGKESGAEKKGKWICWRHATFKEKAFSCNSPKHCQYQGNK